MNDGAQNRGKPRLFTRSPLAVQELCDDMSQLIESVQLGITA